MKKSGAIWFFTFFVVLLWLGPARSQTQDPRQVGLNNTPAATRKVALIIGNGAYTNVKKLKNPPNDAADVAKALKELGFELVGDGAGLNLSQREMKQRIRDFGARLRNGGVGVFYYAGHGVQLNGHNYLLPVELAVESEADLEDAAVDLQFVFNNLRDASNGLNIVILDACRNNPFEGKTRDVRDGLAEVRAATGTLIAYATAPGSVASDGEGRNGTYTASLLKQLKKPDVEVLDMFRQTREDVFAVTKQKQVPWTNESLIGRFCFGGCGVTPATVKPATVTTNDAAFELEYWNAIKDSNDPEEYRGYLAKYPNGQFADIARRRAAGTRGGNGTATRATATPELRPTPTPSPNPGTKATPDSSPPNAPISGGVLNGKAISLPKPVYPAIAAAAGASGTVSVKVTIDEAGNVISATAVSGHPLLQAAAVQAAQGAKFSPTLIAGKPVMVTGIINYNFIANTPRQPNPKQFFNHYLRQDQKPVETVTQDTEKTARAKVYTNWPGNTARGVASFAFCGLPLYNSLVKPKTGWTLP